MKASWKVLKRVAMISKGDAMILRKLDGYKVSWRELKGVLRI